MNTQWEIDEEGGRMHVIPMGDHKDHSMRVNCGCHPLLQANSQYLTVVHNAYDAREFFEFSEEELQGCFHREVQA
jgi:hypothetical protein